jgi:hypothetical protein
MSGCWQAQLRDDAGVVQREKPRALRSRSGKVDRALGGGGAERRPALFPQDATEAVLPSDLFAVVPDSEFLGRLDHHIPIARRPPDPAPGFKHDAADALFAVSADLLFLQHTKGLGGVVRALHIGGVENVAQLVAVETVGAGADGVQVRAKVGAGVSKRSSSQREPIRC